MMVNNYKITTEKMYTDSEIQEKEYTFTWNTNSTERYKIIFLYEGHINSKFSWNNIKDRKLIYKI